MIFVLDRPPRTVVEPLLGCLLASFSGSKRNLDRVEGGVGIVLGPKQDSESEAEGSGCCVLATIFSHALSQLNRHTLPRSWNVA